MPHLLHIYLNIYADKTVRKNALYSISGETFSKESKRMSLCWAAAVSVNQQHPQLNGTKSVYARLHLLNEGRLYKMDQTKININEMQLYYITRWHRCSILTPRVINKVHIGPQFEYIITSVLVFPKHFFTARITHSNSSKVNKQWVIQVTAAERTRGRDEAAHIVHF